MGSHCGHHFGTIGRAHRAHGGRARRLHRVNLGMAYFDEQYLENATLRDDSRAVLRLIRPEDKELLRRGFERLSPQSRYRRFMGAKSRLSEHELQYLTDLDGIDHLAIGAAALDAEGHEEGVGIARFIRSVDDPRVAEVAVAVVDDWQGKGLGTLLLLRLVAAARERGIERFAAHVLTSNDAIRDVLAQLPHGVRVRSSGGELSVEVDLPDVPTAALPTPEDREVPLRRLFELVARGRLLMQQAVHKFTAGGGSSAVGH
jgi:GNAT superfamily N-acetyltransferase